MPAVRAPTLVYAHSHPLTQGTTIPGKDVPQTSKWFLAFDFAERERAPTNRGAEPHQPRGGTAPTEGRKRKVRQGVKVSFLLGGNSTAKVSEQ
eukprot:109886-Rhodomonas_salina.3